MVLTNQYYELIFHYSELIHISTSKMISKRTNTTHDFSVRVRGKVLV